MKVSQSDSLSIVRYILYTIKIRQSDSQKIASYKLDTMETRQSDSQMIDRYALDTMEVKQSDSWTVAFYTMEIVISQNLKVLQMCSHLACFWSIDLWWKDQLNWNDGSWLMLRGQFMSIAKSLNQTIFNFFQTKWKLTFEYIYYIF